MTYNSKPYGPEECGFKRVNGNQSRAKDRQKMTNTGNDKIRKINYYVIAEAAARTSELRFKKKEPNPNPKKPLSPYQLLLIFTVIATLFGVNFWVLQQFLSKNL